MDKLAGPTSHDVVRAARRALRERRVGHTGTLDPFATGLLLLCVGRATRLAEYLSGRPKTYRAVARLGETTETDDLEGAAIATSDAWRSLTEDAVVDAVASLAGEQAQVPPRYSAKKVEGRRAYDLARQGQAVELEAVSVTVHEIRVLELAMPDVAFEVRCSSGTYVRALARDLGERLGCGAHLRELRRTSIGDTRVDGAVPSDRLDDETAREAAWLSPLEALAPMPVVPVDDAAAARVRNGAPLPAPADLPPGATVALAHEGELLAVAAHDQGRLRPRKVLA